MRKRNKFSLSHYKLLTCDMGKLYPISVIDVIPGDTFQQKTSLLIRMSPMLAPVMHPIVARVHHWFVPYRLLWDDFEDFITGGSDGYNVNPPTFPTISSAVEKSSLFDYFGLPITSSTNTIEVSALPFRAYNMIWNNFYRDQDLQDELPIAFESGADTTTTTEIQNVAWHKDYFTTARPWTQKGSEVTIPIGQNESVYYLGVSFKISFTPTAYVPSGGDDYELASYAVTPTTTEITALNAGTATTVTVTLSWHGLGSSGTPSSAISATTTETATVSELTSLPNVITSAYSTNYSPTYTAYSWTAGTALERTYSSFPTGTTSVSATDSSMNIADLRLALSLQKFEEARAKYGSRYIEYLRYLGVVSSDARLQLPEYLGGGKQLLQISEVLQTAPSTDSYVGDMAGHGLGVLSANRYRRFFEEHGVIITLLSVVPASMYTQGIPRMWSKRTMVDFWQKELQTIGMQEVFTTELYGDGTATDSVFGYQDRYDEYRHMQSSVSGDFRDTLDFWHLARQFETAPVLNGTFISCNPSKRIFASQSTDILWIMANHSIQARRFLMKRATTRTL